MRVFRSKKLEPMCVLPDGAEQSELILRWPCGKQVRVELVKFVQIDDNAVIKLMTARGTVEYLIVMKDEEKL